MKKSITLASQFLYYKPSSDNTLLLSSTASYIPVCFPKEENNSFLCGQTEFLLPSFVEVTALSALRKESISHPSITASDLLTLTLPTFFLKLAQHVHFRKAKSQFRRAKQTEFHVCFYQKENIPGPSSVSFFKGPVSSLLFCTVCVPVSRENESMFTIK